MRITHSVSYCIGFITKLALRKTTRAIVAGLFVVSGALLGQNFLTTPTTTHALTPPDSCFAFNSGTGTITDYYDNEANNPANPTCPRAVDIPSTIGGVGVTTIGDNAFYDNQLTSVTIPNSATNIGNNAFAENQLTSVTIPDGVTSIGNNAFYDNQLTSVTIPNSVVSIGERTFSWNQLTSITIPNSATTFGDDIFLGNNLTAITYGGTTYTDSIPLVEQCYAFNSGTITNYLLYDMNLIKNSGIACMKHDITIPGTLGGVVVTSIGDYAFSENQLISVTIPNTATNIGDYAFFSNHLNSVTIPDGVISIGNNAFSANQLTSVTIPNSVTSMGDYAFYYNQLTSVTIPNSVTSMGDYAFYYNQLTSVTIPNSVTTIGEEAFSIQTDIAWDTFWNLLDSNDPLLIQQALDSLRLVQLYTADPTNPYDFTDELYVSSSFELDGDGDWDDTVATGGYVVNPASATIQHHTSAGTPLATTTTLTGHTSDGTALTSYLLKDVLDTTDPDNPTLDFNAYYRAGDTVTIDPLDLSGYVRPTARTMTLTTGSNQAILSYFTQAELDALNLASATTASGGTLSNTGLSQVLLAVVAGVACLGGGTLLLRRRRV